MATLAAPLSCNNEFEGSLPRRDRLNYPIGMAFHPSGDYLYVVNSNFDGRFRPDAGGTVSVINTDTLTIEAQQTPFLPSFGAFIDLNDDASKAYVTSRRGDVVVAYDVAADGSALSCRDDDGQQTSDPSDCAIDRVPDEAGGARLPPDPFGIEVFTVRRNDQPVDVINTTHINASRGAAPRVSSLSLPDRQVSGASLQTAPLLSGNAIAVRPGTEQLYVTGRNTNGVAIFQPYINSAGAVEALIQRGSFVLNNNRANGRRIPVDARGLAFSEAGDEVYVLTRRPDALHVVDIVAARPELGAGTTHQVSSVIPLPDNPSDIELLTTATGRRLAYVSSFDDDSIQVIDIDSRTIIDEILVDASPYEIAIEPGAAECESADDQCRMFVTLFDDTPDGSTSCSEAGSCGSVAVIDINPYHRAADRSQRSRYHTVVSKIK